MYNKKIVSKYKLIILTLITTLITLLSIGCDKGVDSVDFDYYLFHAFRLVAGTGDLEKT